MRRMLAHLAQEDGISLIMAIGVLAVLMALGAVAIQLSSAGQRNSSLSAANAKAFSIAEAGVNNALAVMHNPSVNVVDPNLLLAKTTTYEGGTATWSGALDPTKAVWTITSTGTVKNPTGAADVTRRVTTKVWVSTTVFTSNYPHPLDGSTEYEIWVSNLDGSASYPVTTNDVIDSDAFWAPDIGSFVFETERDCNAATGAGFSFASPVYPFCPSNVNREVYRMNVDGSGVVNLSNNAGTAGVANSSIDEDPQWGPSGWIVFDTDRNGHFDVYKMKADGSSQTNLTPEASWNMAAEEAAYGPSGKVCFQSARNADGTTGSDAELWLMNPDGSGKTALTNNTVNDQECDWSPDGTKIVFDSNENRAGCSGSPTANPTPFNPCGDRDVFVMNADGSGRTRLTTNAYNDANAGWTPAGKIVFDRCINSDGGGCGLSGGDVDGSDDDKMYLVNGDGSGELLISPSGNYQALFPDVRDRFVPYNYSG